MNRKALRLVVQLVTIFKDQSWGINMCVGWFPGHVCRDVHMQLSQCLGTQYSLPCTEWLRGRPFGLLGRGRVFLSLSKDVLSFDLQEKKTKTKLKLGSKQIIWHQNQYNLFDFPKCWNLGRLGYL